jgi:hypothetical protein
MKAFLRIFAVLVCAALLAVGKIPVRAQQSIGHYFPQTGHNVSGEFWTYYEGVTDAAVIFGMPLTEQFPSREDSGLTVQYFEKIRLELHSDQPQGRRVVVSALGTAMYAPGAPAINLTTPGACRTLNGFGVCYDFLAFFDAHGGVDTFGNPISSFEFQPDGRLIQYFERARFEWYPELSAGQTVLLADLGRIYADNHEDPAWLNAVLPLNNIPMLAQVPLTLRARAFVGKAVTHPTDVQKIYVVVQDQTLGPVFGATCQASLRLTTGETLTYPLVTDEHGLAVLPAVKFQDQQVGQPILIDVSVSYQGLTAHTASSFLVWP